ncbi:unnamed protein product [Vitrella brassicaformis CCMP3155]|uniref:Uncharacterized protein n=1 Tax=Vitrella brassicaformis (strain CCMP3155) TaxID=1169540 RepID=A0A0G4F3U5_VITBC|nr:unnamed protein product [Vitrella brassicaformis CCMP3155]|mmetsp:Transcript_7785/g.19131  ORF Transcript_7785/g.19131 Transcript_7785/m.19131 type:complete len:307 (-) Transcript_7785:1098-2018(-)|eukprot:CEM06510.1 unnamed protein product [Vitrella brassicaformis CCMP3155]
MLQIFLCLIGLAAVCGTASSNTNTTATAANPSAADVTTNETSVSMPEADLDATPLNKNVADGEDGDEEERARRRLQFGVGDIQIPDVEDIEAQLDAAENTWSEVYPFSHEGVQGCNDQDLIDMAAAKGHEFAEKWGGGWRFYDAEIDGTPNKIKSGGDVGLFGVEPRKCSITGRVEITMVKEDYWRKIYLRNRCHEPIKIFARYKTTSGEWDCESETVNPEKDFYMSDGGKDIRVDGDSSRIYWYAESTVSSKKISDPDASPRECDGRDLKMRTKDKGDLDTDGNWRISIPPCDRRLRGVTADDED